jgi:hypothetical protein
VDSQRYPAETGGSDSEEQGSSGHRSSKSVEVAGLRRGEGLGCNSEDEEEHSGGALDAKEGSEGGDEERRTGAGLEEGVGGSGEGLGCNMGDEEEHIEGPLNAGDGSEDGDEDGRTGAGMEEGVRGSGEEIGSKKRAEEEGVDEDEAYGDGFDNAATGTSQGIGAPGQGVGYRRGAEERGFDENRVSDGGSEDGVAGATEGVGRSENCKAGNVEMRREGNGEEGEVWSESKGELVVGEPRGSVCGSVEGCKDAVARPAEGEGSAGPGGLNHAEDLQTGRPEGSGVAGAPGSAGGHAATPQESTAVGKDEDEGCTASDSTDRGGLEEHFRLVGAALAQGEKRMLSAITSPWSEAGGCLEGVDLADQIPSEAKWTAEGDGPGTPTPSSARELSGGEVRTVAESVEPGSLTPSSPRETSGGGARISADGVDPGTPPLASGAVGLELEPLSSRTLRGGSDAEEGSAKGCELQPLSPPRQSASTADTWLLDHFQELDLDARGPDPIRQAEAAKPEETTLGGAGDESSICHLLPGTQQNPNIGQQQKIL